ncbi:MAG: anaerobic ribonucleoside-triphosphate reductase activating protein [Promethearchaeia archaeon]
MRIGGIIDISTKDIPAKACMVIFTIGCNLSCGFCHNKHLLRKDVGKIMTISELLGMVKSNILISAVSISGGEPTLQKDLVPLCRGIKELGKYISVDTNGTNPDVIEKLTKFIDRIALDIKAPLTEKKYQLITMSPVNIDSIKESFKIINRYKRIDFEIRTTYVGKLLTPYDIHEIISFLKENNFRGNFVLQQYQYSDGVGEKYKDKFVKPDHYDILNIIRKYYEEKLPFNIYIRDDIVGYADINDVFELKLEDIS